MTIEQGASAPDQPTPTDAPQAPTDRLSAAAQALTKLRGGGESDPPAPTPEAPPPDPDAPALPSLEDLAPLLEQRAADRAAEEKRTAEARELEELRAAKAQWEQAQGQPALKSAQDFLEAFKHLPAAERKAALQLATKSVLSPDLLTVEQQLSQLKDEIGKGGSDSELAKRLERIEADLQADRRARVEDEYLSVAVDKAKRPLLSRLGRAEAVAWGDHVYNQYAEAFQVKTGRPLTHADAADIIERELQAQIQRLTGGESQAGAPAQASDAAKRGTDGLQGSPTTISNDLVADAPASRPQTHEDRVALAAARLEQLRRNDG